MDFTIRHFSPSSINLCLQCPRKFFITNICKIKEPTNKYFAKGNLIHSGIKLAIDLINSQSFDIERVNSYIEELYNTYEDHIRKDIKIQEIKQEVSSVINSQWVKNVISAEHQFALCLQKEGKDIYSCTSDNIWSYNCGHDYYKIVGIVDAIRQIDDTTIIIDWKTGSTKDFEALSSDFQTLIYGVFALHNFPSKSYKVAYVYTSYNTPKSRIISLTPDQIAPMIGKIITQCKAIEQEKVFPVNRSYLCNYCHFNGICDKFTLDVLDKFSLDDLKLYIAELLKEKNNNEFF